MKFFVDANLPFKLASGLKRKGYDVIHTDDCQNREKTTDTEIRTIAQRENRTVITKDTDFLDSHLIQGIPSKLLLVGTGNISNRELFKRFEKYFDQMVNQFENVDLIELTNTQIIIHEKIK